jgi:alkanesulfonate monooxygenase SsuD/methylene tetrahydromethanopterin reductase-like flavin-dependent oxidoreductase (luciferase family)
VSSETRWGLWLHAIRPVAELAELGAAAEALGAAALLVADEGTDRDLYVTLAALAHKTRSILLFGAVTNPFSRHPLATAAAFATLAELAPGRVVCGLGAGGSRVFAPMGIGPRRPFSALVECVEIVERLLRGEIVEHSGELVAHGAALPWSPGPLPLALAGRGPRVERLAAERADWILLAGRPIEHVASLVDRLRATGTSTRGRPPAIGWNPNLAWTPAMIDEVRAHFAYMAADMPPAERALLGPERYAICGTRSDVVRRLATLRQQIQPELVLLDAADYSVAFLEDAAMVMADAGVVAAAGG